MIISAGVMGYSGVRKLRGRVRSLEALIASLDIMESEICSRLTPMREVLEILSTKVGYPARNLYENVLAGMEQLGRCSFYSIWKQAISDTQELLLRQEEQEVLSELGLCLGKYDVREQAETIIRIRRRLEIFLRKAETERDRDSKMHAFFGVGAGVFAVIILL